MSTTSPRGPSQGRVSCAKMEMETEVGMALGRHSSPVCRQCCQPAFGRAPPQHAGSKALLRAGRWVRVTHCTLAEEKGRLNRSILSAGAGPLACIC